MKKQVPVFLSICFLAVFSNTAQASGDTIPGRYKNYYYTHWYDECPTYATNGYYQVGNHTRHEDFDVDICPAVANEIYKFERAWQPLKIKGIAALVMMDAPGYYWHSNNKLPEYVSVHQLVKRTHIDSILMLTQGADWMYHFDDSLVLVDSARWDNLEPRVMAISQGLTDTVNYQYCYVYEAYFEKPVLVDSVFFLMGTNNSNVHSSTYPQVPHFYEYYPTIYADIVPSSRSTCFNTSEGWLRMFYSGSVFMTDTGFCPEGIPFEVWHSPYPENPFGYYLAIVDKYNIDVLSDSLLMGGVSGGGLLPDGWFDTIQALPNPGFLFSHWSDGSTQNPRVVQSTRDTTFIAYFISSDQLYSVQLAANNPDWGTVSGDGAYPVNSVVSISATPSSDTYAFEQWNDGDWNNPRTVTLTQDTSFTAMFAQVLAIDGPDGNPSLTVTPNPAKESVTVASDEPILLLTLTDMQGRTITELHPNSDTATIGIGNCNPGTYLVRIATNHGTAVKKLVVE
ncbi:MAG: T9SS type A sorting domain-containing protein [Bacteroidales bacterium]|nr:T9SS type A sorting domain-containing protein [Bacteroidales bacterium]